MPRYHPAATERRIEKLRAHIRTPRGRGDTAALTALRDALADRDKWDWHKRRDLTELLKLLYPADSVLPLGAPLRALPHPLLSMLRKG